MENKEFYPTKSEVKNEEILTIIVFVIKILVGGILLCTALYITFWAIEVAEQIIYHPEKVPLINSILQSQEGQELFQISSSGNSLVIENGIVIKWMILVFLLLFVFNVLGRALSAVFQCVLNIITSLDMNKRSEAEAN